MNNKVKYPYKVNYCKIKDNITIAYGDEGKGDKTLLFIHGLANYGPIWKNNIDVLKDNHRCIAIDLPGNGLSSRGDYPYTMFFYAECVAQFINTLKLENVVLVGHSMGGHVSTIIALRYPALIHKLVLVAPSGFEHFTSTERTMLKNITNFGSYLISDKISLKLAIENSFVKINVGWVDKVLTDLNLLIDEFGSNSWQKMVMANINAMLDEQINMFLPYLEVPTLVLFGNNDQLIPNKLIHYNLTVKELVNKVEALIPTCKMVLIDNCGHLVQTEKPELFNMQVDNFVLAS